MAEEFERQYRITKDTVSAEVVSAIPLTDDMRSKVLSIVKTLDNRSDVSLIEKVDKDIIGGIIVRVGDKQLDYSVFGLKSSLAFGAGFNIPECAENSSGSSTRDVNENIVSNKDDSPKAETLSTAPRRMFTNY